MGVSLNAQTFQQFYAIAISLTGCVLTTFTYSYNYSTGRAHFSSSNTSKNPKQYDED